ncbi:MAG: glutathione S-transferase family protein, partial [Pseudomonadota bacterium]
RWNAIIHRDFNNGVYRAGFAESQEAYEIAALGVFGAMDRLEGRLSASPWLCGEVLTEADLRLFPTLVRFDVAYHYAFRLNRAKLTDYPALWDYARAIYQLPGVRETVFFDVYKRGYHSPSEKRNPLGIVPIGPRLPDWDAPHGRG